MRFDLPKAQEVLKRTPSTLDAMLRGTSPVWHGVNEGPDTWSPIDVVGHLIHGEETDWVPRARIILEHGAAGSSDAPKAFEPFNRLAQFERFTDWSLERRLDRFAELRKENLQILQNWRLSESQLALPGQHPALGPVTLGQLLATWAVHDLNHIAQISRVMAKAYTEEVGPWREYLSILNR